MARQPKLSKAWGKIELAVHERMGPKYFLKNPPRYWGGLDERRASRNRDVEQVIEKIYEELIFSEIRCFKKNTVMFNRFMEDLVSEKRKIIIHSQRLRQSRQDLYFTFGYKTIYAPRDSDGRRIEQIVSEVWNVKQMDG